MKKSSNKEITFWRHNFKEVSQKLAVPYLADTTKMALVTELKSDIQNELVKVKKAIHAYEQLKNEKNKKFKDSCFGVIFQNLFKFGLLGLILVAPLLALGHITGVMNISAIIDLAIFGTIIGAFSSFAVDLNQYPFLKDIGKTKMHKDNEYALINKRVSLETFKDELDIAEKKLKHDQETNQQHEISVEEEVYNYGLYQTDYFITEQANLYHILDARNYCIVLFHVKHLQELLNSYEKAVILEEKRHIAQQIDELTSTIMTCYENPEDAYKRMRVKGDN